MRPIMAVSSVTPPRSSRARQASAIISHHSRMDSVVSRIASPRVSPVDEAGVGRRRIGTERVGTDKSGGGYRSLPEAEEDGDGRVAQEDQETHDHQDGGEAHPLSDGGGALLGLGGDALSDGAGLGGHRVAH